ncbi:MULTISPECIES: hypothetical protein [unclassified Oceanobacillus]|nr:hypothetical protein [Oceanobacillus sp. AG]
MTIKTEQYHSNTGISYITCSNYHNQLIIANSFMITYDISMQDNAKVVNR